MMGSARYENKATAPADWATWTPFTLEGLWEIGLSEIIECLLNETQSLLVVSLPVWWCWLDRLGLGPPALMAA